MSYWQTSFFALGIGFAAQVAQELLGTDYLSEFLSENLITLLIALLAVNSATLGIVLTKIRELVDKCGNSDVFDSSKKEMLLAVKEQIVLITMAVIFLTLLSSGLVAECEWIALLLKASVIGVFVYALIVLYDISKSILMIVDFDCGT